MATKRRKPTRSQREATRVLKTANARAEARGLTLKNRGK